MDLDRSDGDTGFLFGYNEWWLEENIQVLDCVEHVKLSFYVFQMCLEVCKVLKKMSHYGRLETNGFFLPKNKKVEFNQRIKEKTITGSKKI